MPNTIIEILPWHHAENTVAHHELLRYIDSLPRNTTVAWEMRWKDAPLATEHDNEAAADLALLFQKKDFKVVPIESNAILNLNDTKTTLGQEKISKERERLFAERIARISYTSKPKRIIVVTGSAHVWGIAHELAKKGINCKINTKIYSQAKLLRRLIRTSGFSRKFIEKNQKELHTEKVLRESMDIWMPQMMAVQRLERNDKENIFNASLLTLDRRCNLRAQRTPEQRLAKHNQRHRK